MDIIVRWSPFNQHYKTFSYQLHWWNTTHIFANAIGAIPNEFILHKFVLPGNIWNSTLNLIHGLLNLDFHMETMICKNACWSTNNFSLRTTLDNDKKFGLIEFMENFSFLFNVYLNYSMSNINHLKCKFNIWKTCNMWKTTSNKNIKVTHMDTRYKWKPMKGEPFFYLLLWIFTHQKLMHVDSKNDPGLTRVQG